MLKIIISVMAVAGLLLADGPVLKTGQTTEYKTGDDGTYQAGTARSYTRSAAGVVTDNATGLEWQDDALSPSMNWADAATYCTSLALDGGGWRLPTQQELRTLVDSSRVSPSIDPTFQSVTSGHYWSSTTYAGDTSFAWFVYFDVGGDGLGNKTNSTYVRCVRGGQPI